MEEGDDVEGAFPVGGQGLVEVGVDGEAEPISCVLRGDVGDLDAFDLPPRGAESTSAHSVETAEPADAAVISPAQPTQLPGLE